MSKPIDINEIHKMAQICLGKQVDLNTTKYAIKAGFLDWLTDLYKADYRQTIKGKWIHTQKGCVHTCSNCKVRLELCYPDGTEVTILPYCPYCGARMNLKESLLTCQKPTIQNALAKTVHTEK